VVVKSHVVVGDGNRMLPIAAANTNDATRVHYFLTASHPATARMDSTAGPESPGSTAHILSSGLFGLRYLSGYARTATETSMRRLGAPRRQSRLPTAPLRSQDFPPLRPGAYQRGSLLPETIATMLTTADVASAHSAASLNAAVRLCASAFAKSNAARA